MAALVYEKMKMKYLWMNEAVYVFVKEGSLVEVSYVEPSFWEVLISNSWFQGLMAYERMIWTMSYDMCHMLCALAKW